jgi:hypothetical protein
LARQNNTDSSQKCLDPCQHAISFLHVKCGFILARKSDPSPLEWLGLTLTRQAYHNPPLPGLGTAMLRQHRSDQCRTCYFLWQWGSPLPCSFFKCCFWIIWVQNGLEWFRHCLVRQLFTIHLSRMLEH